MQKYKAIYYGGMLLFACVVLLSVTEPAAPVRRIRAGAPVSAYAPTFALSRHTPGRVNCYRLVYTRTEEETAHDYAARFDMTPAGADEDAYYFSGEAGRLTVYRHAQRLTFFPAAPVNAAPEDFFAWYNLPVPYEELRIAQDGTSRTVTFVNILDNLYHHAFNAQLALDETGGIVQADYYFCAYEKLGQCRVMSVRDAFDELPQPERGPVSLTQCKLVYAYANSVIQPAYLFEGEDADGNTVTHFVIAAVYEKA